MPNTLERFRLSTANATAVPPFYRRTNQANTENEYITVDAVVPYRGLPTARVFVGPTTVGVDNRREIHEYEDGNEDARLVAEGETVYWAWSMRLASDYPDADGHQTVFQCKSYGSNTTSSAGVSGISPQVELKMVGASGSSNGIGTGGFALSLRGGDLAGGGSGTINNYLLIARADVQKGVWWDIVLRCTFDKDDGQARTQVFHRIAGNNPWTTLHDSTVPNHFTDSGKSGLLATCPNGARWGMYRQSGLSANASQTFDLRVTGRTKGPTFAAVVAEQWRDIAYSGAVPI